MNNFLFARKEDLKIFKSYVDSADEAMKESISSYKEAHYSFIECMSFFENLMEPINELLAKYNYLNDFGEPVSEILIEMEMYKKSKLNYIFQSKQIFEMLTNSKTTSEEQERYKALLLNKFIDSGVLLNKEKRNELNEIDKELFILEKKFLSNLNEGRKEWSFHINEYEFENSPEKIQKFFKNNGEDSYIMNYSLSACQSLMMFCPLIEVRERLEKSLNSLVSCGKYNNEPIVYKIIDLSYRKTEIQGYDSPSQKIMKESLGGTAKEVLIFLKSFNKKISPILNNEYKKVANLYKETEGRNLESYSVQYAIEKLREKTFSSHDFHYEKDQESLYFKNIKESLPILFDFFKELYGFDIDFLAEDESVDYFNLNKNKDLKNNNNLEFLTISENGDLKGHIILDLYERKGKKGGAWASNIIPLRNMDKNGKINNNVNNIFKRIKNKTALFGVSCNFSQDNGLNFSNLKTLLHEFGHCLHYASSKVDFSDMAGTNLMVRDAVEIPSMMLEKFYNDEYLIKKLSNGKMPKEIIKIAKKQSSFMIGDFYNRRLIAPAIFDLKIFSDKPFVEKMIENNSLIQDFVKTYNDNTKFGTSSENNMPLTFTHLFGGNYKSGYYGYFLSDIYAIDVFEKIKEDFNNGKMFKSEFMSYGSSVPAKMLYEKFNPSGISLDKVLSFYELKKETKDMNLKSSVKLNV